MKTYIATTNQKNSFENVVNFPQKYYFTKNDFFACSFIYTDSIEKAMKKASELKDNDYKQNSPHIKLWLFCKQTDENYLYYNYTWVRFN